MRLPKLLNQEGSTSGIHWSTSTFFGVGSILLMAMAVLVLLFVRALGDNGACNVPERIQFDLAQSVRPHRLHRPTKYLVRAAP